MVVFLLIVLGPGGAINDVTLVKGGWAKLEGMKLCGGPLNHLLEPFLGHLLVPAIDLPLEQCSCMP